jgi:hypothetical protein
VSEMTAISIGGAGAAGRRPRGQHDGTRAAYPDAAPSE